MAILHFFLLQFPQQLEEGVELIMEEVIILMVEMVVLVEEVPVMVPV